MTSWRSKPLAKQNSATYHQTGHNNHNNQNQEEDETSLYLGYRKLKSVSEDVISQTQLTRLLLHDNLLTCLPLNISSLSNLISLNLSNNLISELPVSFSSLTNLQIIFADHNTLTSFPLPLTSLTSLRKLSIAANRLQNPALESIFRLASLELLDISENGLTKFPSTISCLTNLQTLRAIRNEFTELPSEIGFLTKIQQIFFDDNKFDSLPDEMSRLAQLRELSLNNNQLDASFPDGFNLLTHLHKLHLAKNLFLSFGSNYGLWGLISLDSINLAYNNIPALPPDLKELTALTELNLEHNIINSMPPEIGCLVHLRDLNLEYNQLSFIPPEIKGCEKLRKLNLGHNQFEWLPVQLGQLTDLKRLIVNNNPLSSLPDSLKKADTVEIQKHLLQLPKVNLVWNRLKILVVGDLRVGKSSLIRSITEKKKKKKRMFNTVRPNSLISKKNTNPSSTSLPSTTSHFFGNGLKSSAGHHEPNQGHNQENKPIGAGTSSGMELVRWSPEISLRKTAPHEPQSYVISANEREKKVATKDGEADPALLIDFTFCEFASQEIYFPIHQYFLSRRALYLLVVDLSNESSSRIDYWINTILSRAPRPTILLVATHLDLVPDSERQALLDRVSERYLRRYSMIKGFLSTSCLNRDGVDALREKIVEISMKDHTLRERVPKSYQLLAQVLKYEREKRQQRAIKWSTFEDLALAAGVQNDDVPVAAEFLTDTGVIVHFDDPQFRDLVILDAQHLASLMASVFTLKPEIVKAGILHAADLTKVWPYPQDQITKFVTLLIKFEILYQIPMIPSERGQKEKYMIPSRLPEERPSNLMADWEKNGSQSQFGRIFKYKFLPLGFFSRLMIRTLHLPLLVPQNYWMNGFVVRLSGERTALALLEYNPQEYSLSLSVREEVPGAGLGLLRVLLETIEALASGWYQAKADVKIPCCHCLKLNRGLVVSPELFSLDECVDAIRSGRNFVICRGSNRTVRVDALAPDIAFRDFRRRRIKYSELTIMRVLGKGAFGTVYLGLLDNEEVAIKQLASPNENESTEALDTIPAAGLDATSVSAPSSEIEEEKQAAFAEFQREVFIMGCLEHRNLVKLIGITLQPLAMVMECLPLGTLYHLLVAEDVTWNNLLRLHVAADIALGMKYLHSVVPPIIHRDLRSPNILMASLDPTDKVCAKVADFGLSRLLAPTMAGGDFNPNWLAPEIMRGKEYTGSADVYSYGIINWEILTGARPFEEYEQHWRNPFAFKQAVIQGLRPTISAANSAELPEFCSLIASCWDDDPERRPTFDAIVDEMKHLTPLDDDGETKDSREVKANLIESVGVNNGLQPIEDLNEIGELTDEENVDDDDETCEEEEKTQIHPIQPRLARQTSNPRGSISAKDSINFENSSRKSRRLPAQYGGMLTQVFGNILCITSVPTNNTVWIATAHGSIHVFRSEGELVKEFEVVSSKNKRAIYHLIVVNQTVWSTHEDGDIYVWDIETLARVKRKKKGHNVPILSGSHVNREESSTVWTGSTDGVLRIWNAKDLKKRKTHKLPHSIFSISHSDQNVFLAVGCYIYAYNPTTFAGRVYWNAHEENISSVITVGNQLWTASADRSIRVWDAAEGSLIRSLKSHKTKVQVLLDTPQYVLSGSSDRSIILWNKETFELTQELTLVQECVRGLELVNGSVVWSGVGAKENHIYWWNLYQRGSLSSSASTKVSPTSTSI
eukprot:TRINITY_DN1176_c0_g1_i2.p1 TRINITY_DN1176_c0_g1~~TRINITY_DN1176_c0_g1_i2.p1  ORF type:complete len:1699 (+),score=387.97 TRINITY_DN1176_c0_g1_i2:81-5177(+)